MEKVSDTRYRQTKADVTKLLVSLCDTVQYLLEISVYVLITTPFSCTMVLYGVKDRTELLYASNSKCKLV